MQRKAESYKLIPILIHENKRIIKNKLLLSQYEILKETTIMPLKIFMYYIKVKV